MARSAGPELPRRPAGSPGPAACPVPWSSAGSIRGTASEPVTGSAEASSVADPAQRPRRRMRAPARQHRPAHGTLKSPRYYRTVTGLLSACLESETQIVEVARDLVAAESPSTDPDALEQCATVLVARLAEAGASVERVDATST